LEFTEKSVTSPLCLAEGIRKLKVDGGMPIKSHALDSTLVTPVKLPPMPRAQQHSALRRSLLVFTVVSTIALLFLFSVTLASSAGNGFYHITLDLPVFFLLLVLTAFTGGWIPAEDAIFHPKPAAHASPTRAPPASFF
jgi:hypothetical protein